ncbi:MAG: FAD-binding protein [Anaerolineae bacterium]|nr:FAD-binding protein [Anaerolineae bacterium]
MVAVSAPSAVNDFAAALRRRSKGDVRTDHTNRVLYSTDASIYQIMPLAVVHPRTTDDVIATMEAAAEFGLPVLPRGSGTSLAGQAVNEAVIIDMTRLNRVLEFNGPARTVRVEPGIILKRLNDAMGLRGLKFGPDPATDDRAEIGGITGNNSTGSHSILYGMTADHVIGMDVVLADGSLATFGPVDAATIGQKAALDTREGQIYRQVPAIIDAHADAIRAHIPATWRRCGGYNLDRLIPGADDQPGPPLRLPNEQFNLAQLMVGSEGTLATVIGVTLNLVPLPPAKALAVLHFDRLIDALEAVPVILEVEPSAVELLDKTQMDLCRASAAWRPRLWFVQGAPEAVLVTEFYGADEAELTAKLDRLAAYLKRQGVPVGAMPRMLDAKAQADVWGVRKAGLGLLMSLRGDAKPVPFIEDVAVPVASLSAYVTDVQRVCAEVNTPLAMYAHASAGCVHIRPIVNLKGTDGIAAMQYIARGVADLVLGYKGALSSEHGDGRVRSWLNPHIFGAEIFGVFGQVKAAFDPDGRMNPGNIVDPLPIDYHLRFGLEYATLPLYERLDWSADHGFAGAVEMCNGAGVCRKVDGGTMCPSYMVTLEEEHSTRGRANLLRAALSGLIPREELFGERMHEALDLCISCKACKSECPSAVDMARIKLEWQAHYYRHHRPSPRTSLFAHMPLLSRVASLLPELANGVLGSTVTRGVMDLALGIDRRRALPRFERAFTAVPHVARQTGQKVVLYVDTWANFNETQVAQAAWDVLTAAGYEVIIPPYTCCGRTYLSKGFIAEATRCADRVMNTLAPYGRAGVPIVGLEPSCILTLRDEHQYLSNHPDRAAVGQNTYTFEEFAAQHAEEWADLFTHEAYRPVILHGHCHQKALVGTAPARTALGLRSDSVQEVDSGCCGMAGAFGYEKEHYDLSQQMAYRRLVEAMRAAPQEAVLVAAGTSCRHQIKDFSGREAVHPAVALAQALKG